MKGELISVIIPVYNAENTIQRCIASIQNNSYKELEIICVNDGSTDHSLEQLRSIQKTDDRILILDQENKGVSVARNAGLRIAQGGYIAFIDADDWVHQEYFQILFTAIGKSEIVHCGHIICNTDQEDMPQHVQTRVIPASSGHQDYSVKSHVTGKLFRAELLNGLSFTPDIVMAEDKLFTLQAIGRANNITIVDNQLYYYYQSSTSAVHTFGQNMLPVARELLHLAEKNQNAVILHDAYTAFLAHRYLNMFESNNIEMKRIVNRELKNCKKLAKEIMPWKERILLNIMVAFPIIYRVWRIADDRTMLYWELEQKRKKKIQE